MPTPDPAIYNSKSQTQYVLSREGSGVCIDMSQEKKVHTVLYKNFKSGIKIIIILKELMINDLTEIFNCRKNNLKYNESIDSDSKTFARGTFSKSTILTI